MHYLRSESTQGGLRMKWVTREKAKVDRIACPWLITKFVDPKAEFLFVPREKVLNVAKERGAIPYDSPGAELFHYKQDGDERCSFDAIIKKYKLTDPALLDMAEIVRAADAAPRIPRPEGAGLEAMALGFRANSKADFENMRLEFPAYDALYTFCRLKVEGKAELEHATRWASGFWATSSFPRMRRKVALITPRSITSPPGFTSPIRRTMMSTSLTPPPIGSFGPFTD